MSNAEDSSRVRPIDQSPEELAALGELNTHRVPTGHYEPVTHLQLSTAGDILASGEGGVNYASELSQRVLYPHPQISFCSI